MAKIEIKDLTFHYKGNQGKAAGVEHIDLSIEEGEFICLLGPSGCGKSTLLSLLMGLNRADEGRILIDGNEVTGPGRERAVVFQHYSLFPWLTARKNIIMGMKQSAHRHTKAEMRTLADSWLEKVELLGEADKYPSELSGGMQQRVAIARALAMEPDILLMDEPFGAIDPKLRRDLQTLVGKLSRENRKTVVFVTHDIDEAMLLADRIVVMEPKKIRSIEKVEIKRPRDYDSVSQGRDYLKMRQQLLSQYYRRVADEIYDEVVL